MFAPLLLALLATAPKPLCPAELAELEPPAWGQTEASLRHRLPLTEPIINHDRGHKWRWQGQSCVGGLPAFVTYGFSRDRLVELWISVDDHRVKISRAQFERVKAWVVGWAGEAKTRANKADRDASWQSEGVDASLFLTHSEGRASLQLTLRDPSSLGH